MPRLIGFLGGQTQNGQFTLTAQTNLDQVPASQIIRVLENKNQFLTGTILNKSYIKITVVLYDFNGAVMIRYDMQPYGKLTVKNLSCEKIGFTSEDDATIHILLQKWQISRWESLTETLPDVEFREEASDTPYRVYDLYDNTAINSATTTTIAAPSVGNLVLRVLQVSINVDAAAIVTLKWTDADGTSNVNQISKVQFTSAGTFIVGLGVDGLQCPNGEGGLLRATTNNTANVNIDVIYQETENFG